jgi:glycerol-3-phosphate acyltransferase PlsX
MTTTIAVDAMSGDCGTEVTVPASLNILRQDKDLELLLVGDAEKIKEELGDYSDVAKRVEIQAASEIVEMDEPPALALKKKKDSSMRVAIDMVKVGRAQAAVSAGNTGALMATSRFVLKMIPGLKRPAICGELPTLSGHVRMLDLGANVECGPDMLRQFAIMGSVLASEVDGIKEPSIGLLNIGAEDIKGSEVVKQASKLIADSGLNYHGYVEADEIYSGRMDVIVADGFSGNVSLKTSEGVAKFIMGVMREEFAKNFITKLVALIALPIMRAAGIRMDPRRYNGASLLGLRGTVVKSHGGADILAFEYAITEAAKQAKMSVPKRISAAVERQLESFESPPSS